MHWILAVICSKILQSCSRSFELDFEHRVPAPRAKGKTISSASLSLISTLAQRADEKFSLRDPSPLFPSRLSPPRRYYTTGGTISFLRDDVENRKVGWETGGRKGRTKSHRKGRRPTPLLPFSSSLTIYPFGTTAPPSSAYALPRNSFYSRFYPQHHSSVYLILRHCFLFISLYSLFSFSFSYFQLEFPIIRQKKKINREGKIKISIRQINDPFNHLMEPYFNRVAINIS